MRAFIEKHGVGSDVHKHMSMVYGQCVHLALAEFDKVMNDYLVLKAVHVLLSPKLAVHLSGATINDIRRAELPHHVRAKLALDSLLEKPFSRLEVDDLKLTIEFKEYAADIVHDRAALAAAVAANEQPPTLAGIDTWSQPLTTARFPVLAPVARLILSVRSSNAPLESVFSVLDGSVDGKQQQNKKKSSVEGELFIKVNPTIAEMRDDVSVDTYDVSDDESSSSSSSSRS